MEYPLFEVPQLSSSLVIAIIAIVHVVIAHFAVGAGLFMAVTHTLALRRGDELLLRYVKDHARFLVLLAFVAGAATGVGIWFSIGLSSPSATSRLIHFFVWAWATEWCFFLIEIVAGYVYYYGFGRLRPALHLATVWIYAVAAFFSLVIINGILTFMLTPSRWADMVVEDRHFNAGAFFWIGLFNDTYWPSLIMRTVSALALAAIFVAVIVNVQRHYTRDERQRIINVGAYFMAPLALMALVAPWYYAELPAPAQRMIRGAAAAMMLFMMFGIAASVLITAYAYFGLIRAKRYIALETALLLLGMAFIATGAMEFVREGVRKPFLIYDVLFSNGIPTYNDWPEKIARDGLLRHAPFALPPGESVAALQRQPLAVAGERVFTAQCRICHEIDGYNAIRPMIHGRRRELLAAILQELQIYPYMPPFHGNQWELKALLEYLTQLAQGAEYTPISSERLDEILRNARPPTPARAGSTP